MSGALASESVGEVTGIMVIIHFVEPNEDDVNYLEMVYPWEIEISECIGAAVCTFYPAGPNKNVLAQLTTMAY